MTSHRAYLLLGPEVGLKNEFVDALAKQLSARASGALDIHKVYPFETSALELVSLLRNGSLFAQHRLVILNDAQEIKKRDEVELLVDYLKQPAPDATLLLLSDETSVDSRDGRFSPAIAKLFPKDGPTRKIFWELFENQKRDWVMSFFGKAGASITPDAVELLLDMVENNTLDLRNECAQLAQFFGRGRTIEADDLEGYLYHSKQENVFTLFDRVAARDLEGSFEILRAMTLSGDAEGSQILGGLAWQFRRLVAVKALTAERYGIEEACLKCGVRGKRAQRSYVAGVKSFSRRELERIIVLIADCDALLRSVRSELGLLSLELFLYTCIIRKGEPIEAYRA